MTRNVSKATLSVEVLQGKSTGGKCYKGEGWPQAKAKGKGDETKKKTSLGGNPARSPNAHSLQQV